MKNPRNLRRLLGHMQWVAILSESEAISAIIAYRQGDVMYGGSEAVVHFGGPRAVIHQAWRLRDLHRVATRPVWDDYHNSEVW